MQSLYETYMHKMWSLLEQSLDGGTNIQGKLSTLNRIQSYDGKENDEQQEMDKQNQYLRRAVIDVFGKETEAICYYLRCHHKFLEHGLIRKCQCKHPRNSAAGTYKLHSS